MAKNNNPELLFDHPGIVMPTPTEAELLLMRGIPDSPDGAYGYGVMTGIFDMEGNIIVLQHSGVNDSPDDEKRIERGTWGVLGETAKAELSSDGLKLEPTVHNLLRGIHEELGVELGPSDIWVPRAVARMMTKVQVFKGGEWHTSVVTTPIVVVEDVVKEKLLDAPTGGEVMAKKIIRPEDVRTLEKVRPGTDALVAATCQLKASVDEFGYVHPANVPWNPSGTLLNAVLPRLFEAKQVA